MNKQEAIDSFEGPRKSRRARYAHEFKSLVEATAAHQRLALSYPGPYNFTGEIALLDDDSFVVLGHWENLGD